MLNVNPNQPWFGPPNPERNAWMSLDFMIPRSSSTLPLYHFALNRKCKVSLCTRLVHFLLRVQVHQFCFYLRPDRPKCWFVTAIEFYYFTELKKTGFDSQILPRRQLVIFFCHFWTTACSLNKLTLILQDRAYGMEITWLHWLQVTLQVTCDNHGVSFIKHRMWQTMNEKL